MDVSKKTERINQRLEAHYGIPGRKAAHADPLRSLVLTILSQNTTDVNAARAFDAMEARFSGADGRVEWAKVAQAPVDELAAAIRSGGLSRQKSGRIQNILTWIRETYGGYRIDLLREMDPLSAIETFTRLKGIGVKTIAVVLAFSCEMDVFPVDTHVHRVCRRLGLVKATLSAEKTFWAMREVIPPGKSFSLHLNMIRLGREICKARKPGCGGCPLAGLCDYARETKY